MKLRVSLELPNGGTHDIVLSCDVTATVGDAARALARSGATQDAELERSAQQRLVPLTLLAREVARSAPAAQQLAHRSGAASQIGGSLLLDPMSPIAESGLRSGWIIRPVAEFGPHSTGTRVHEVAGFVEVTSGRQCGARFSLLHGRNVIGRDAGCRVLLLEPSVSRRHAEIVIDNGSPHGTPGLLIRDLGSANGIRSDGRIRSEHRFTRPTEFALGDITLTVTPGPPGSATPTMPLAVQHTRAPRVAPSFPRTRRELPAPPTPQEPHGIPMLAMLAPMMMGVAVYAITSSPMSLIMVAFSPMMMIGSWLDGMLGGRRKFTREVKRFRETLTSEHVDLSERGAREITVRAAETPTLSEVGAAIEQRGALLWTRRPEHRSFLEVRFGEGSLPSRTELQLPSRGESQAEHWRELQQLADAHRHVAPVPVLERLDRCGSIGVAGDPLWAEGMARSLVLQLIGLHSPTEVVLSCFAGPQHDREWGWLKWVPHVDPVGSPISSWQLADSSEGSLRLVLALEALLEARTATGGGATAAGARSHLDAGARNDAGHGEAVDALPTLPAVIVLVLESTLVDQSRLIALAEHGPDAGIHVIWVAHRTAQLPAACRTFVEFGAPSGGAVGAEAATSARVGFVRSGTTVALERVEFVEQATAARLARVLAPIEDTAARGLDESDLPRSVDLRELHQTDLLGGGGPILRSWQQSGSLVSTWRSGEDREPVPLTAVVGQSPDGPATIDLRVHGPHALVGGTTGAGKSEFLQSWIMSLAAGISPDRLTFLLVDYKGGAAFAECAELPHTVGLVTDLSPHLVRRALTSLRAELKYREELLSAHGAKDLLTMERRSDPAAPPSLVIVVDEFAALATEVPEFLDGVIDVAQRGRSLGLHLVLATQRPAGVITDNLRANTNLRIALRMADETDSSDVIGVHDAAFFAPETPGRGAIKVGPGRITHFQTGYLGGRAGGETRAPEIEVRSLGFTEGEPWAIPVSSPRVPPGSDAAPAMPSPDAASGSATGSATGSAAGLAAAQKPPRDIERLRDGVQHAATQASIASPRRPWLDELPQLLRLGALTQQAQQAQQAQHRGVPGDAPLLGMLDDPAAQSQMPEAIDFEAIGNLSLLGAGGTGKTSALLTLVASLNADPVRSPVQVYAIDAAGGSLDALRSLPTVGAVAPSNDAELTLRVLRHLIGLIAERGPRYAAARAANLSGYRAANPLASPDPRVFLLLDGFSAFQQSADSFPGADSPLDLLSEIMTAGRAVGVHAVLTSDRPSAIPAGLASTVQLQLVLRLSNENDYGYAGVDAEALAGAPAGRAVRPGDPREIQIALAFAVTPDESTESGASDGRPARLIGLSEQALALEVLAAQLREDGVAPAPRIVNAPESIPLHELPREAGGRPVYGIDTGSFGPVTMPRAGLGVIAGPSGAGLSTAMLSCRAALHRFAARQGQGVDSVLLSFADDGLAAHTNWSSIALGEDEVARTAAMLITALGGKPAQESGRFGAGSLSDDLLSGSLLNSRLLDEDPVSDPSEREATTAPPPSNHHLRFPRPGALGLIVIERPADAEDTSALPQLVALAKAARRADVLVLFEFETGTASGVWELFSALKQPRWGLSLQPDDGEAQTPFREDLGRVRRAGFPPGRGFAIESGRATPVHVALADEPE